MDRLVAADYLPDDRCARRAGVGLLVDPVVCGDLALPMAGCDDCVLYDQPFRAHARLRCAPVSRRTDRAVHASNRARARESSRQTYSPSLISGLTRWDFWHSAEERIPSTMNQSPLIDIQNVHYTYPARKGRNDMVPPVMALRDVSLHV